MKNTQIATGMLVILLSFSASFAQAQKRNLRSPGAEDSGWGLTWDLGGSAGSYNGVGYSEVNLGVNWAFTDYLVWRNAVFSRFPSSGDAVQGLDTSLRLQHAVTSDDGTFGLGFFGGPGYRFSSATYSAAFAEAGVQVKLGGLRLGGGVKAFRYSNPGTDTRGVALPADDVTYFIILSGGGAI